jgi:serine/threonine-protein kinase
MALVFRVIVLTALGALGGQGIAGCGGGDPTPSAVHVGGGGQGGYVPGAGVAFRYFPEGAVWHQDISGAPVDPESNAIVSKVAAAGGFGLGAIVVDFEIEVMTAGDDAPFVPFVRTRNFFEPHCDFVPMPLPAGGALEAEDGYQCKGGGDCHLIVHHMPSRRLFEMWRADVEGDVFAGGCLAVWDLSRVYGSTGRGAGCSSADAAGFPIAPLLFSADEVRAGEIAHAVRLVLPNDRIRGGAYVSPATHSTPSASGGPRTPPFGARFRLRGDYPVARLPSQGAQIVARALQRYGMFLADGGKKALTARSDRFTAAKWGAGPLRLLDEHDLRALAITDFEMVEGGARIPFTGECTREP